MRPIYGCPENFRESMSTHKFVALTIPEIIGGIQKMWVVPGYAHAPFPP